MCAYCASIQESTGYTPNMLMLGRETTLPVDLLYPTPDQDVNSGVFPVEYVEWVRQAMEENFARVRAELQAASVRQKKNYDKRAQTRTFTPGEWVLRFYPPNVTRSKLNFPYRGPYLVLKKVTEVNYQIQESPRSITLTVHVDDLKKYHGQPSQPSWLPMELQDADGQSEDSPDHPSDDSQLEEDTAFSGDDGLDIYQAPTPPIEMDPPQVSEEPLRPKRQRRPPRRFQDYVM